MSGLLKPLQNVLRLHNRLRGSAADRLGQHVCSCVVVARRRAYACRTRRQVRRGPVCSPTNVDRFQRGTLLARRGASSREWSKCVTPQPCPCGACLSWVGQCRDVGSSRCSSLQRRHVRASWHRRQPRRYASLRFAWRRAWHTYFNEVLVFAPPGGACGPAGLVSRPVWVSILPVETSHVWAPTRAWLGYTRPGASSRHSRGSHDGAGAGVIGRSRRPEPQPRCIRSVRAIATRGRTRNGRQCRVSATYSVSERACSRARSRRRPGYVPASECEPESARWGGHCLLESIARRTRGVSSRYSIWSYSFGCSYAYGAGES